MGQTITPEKKDLVDNKDAAKKADSAAKKVATTAKKMADAEKRGIPLWRAPVSAKPLPKDATIVERFPLVEPYLSIAIMQEPGKNSYTYGIDEVRLTPEAAEIYSNIIDILQYELKAPRGGVSPHEYFEDAAGKIIEKYRLRMKDVSISWPTILYFAERDMVGFGPIDPFMKDPNIEDISVDGLNKPVYIWHRKYESLETNLHFEDEKDLDDTISRLVHLAGKHISTAYPVVDATLPGRHRLAATFKREVTPYGGTLTIRKFREDPVTVIDLLDYGTLDHRIAAYAWLLMEHRASSLIVGATASGKTTFLNAILSMTRPSYKIITIEEVQEINLPNDNWIAMTSRPSYGLSSERVGEISLFDLVKSAMRMRPDILVLGEVRGEEAYVLFQAISTGHGGMSTLHAEEVSSAMQRLTSKPMDVAPAYISFLDLVFLVRRVAIPARKGRMTFGRRVLAVDEVSQFGQYLRMFEWDPMTDTHTMVQPDFSKSVKIGKLAKTVGKNTAELTEEIKRRELILKWMQMEGIRNYRKVGAIFEQYYRTPQEIYKQAEAAMPRIKEAKHHEVPARN